jgi:hypothetical protein
MKDTLLDKLYLWILKYFFPHLSMSRMDLLKKMKKLYAVIREEKEETKMWRDRCIAVEHAYYEAFQNMANIAKKCNREKDTGLREWPL